MRPTLTLGLCATLLGCGGRAPNSTGDGVVTIADEADDGPTTQGDSAGESETIGTKLDQGGNDENPTTGDTEGECGTITATIRDMPLAHPDFQTFSNDVATPGLVQNTLGPDDKPVFSGNIGDPQQMTPPTISRSGTMTSRGSTCPSRSSCR